MREIREELGVAVQDVRLLGVLEDRFSLGGQQGHEVVFVFDARSVDESRSQRGKLPFHEEGWSSGEARWFDLARTEQDFARLVPEALSEFVKDPGPPARARSTSGFTPRATAVPLHVRGTVPVGHGVLLRFPGRGSPEEAPTSLALSVTPERVNLCGSTPKGVGVATCKYTPTTATPVSVTAGMRARPPGGPRFGATAGWVQLHDRGRATTGGVPGGFRWWLSGGRAGWWPSAARRGNAAQRWERR